MGFHLVSCVALCDEVQEISQTKTAALNFCGYILDLYKWYKFWFGAPLGLGVKHSERTVCTFSSITMFLHIYHHEEATVKE